MQDRVNRALINVIIEKNPGRDFIGDIVHSVRMLSRVELERVQLPYRIKRSCTTQRPSLIRPLFENGRLILRPVEAHTRRDVLVVTATSRPVNLTFQIQICLTREILCLIS